jgi:hypothetical protein
MKMPDCHEITSEQLRLAHQSFLQNEPRDLFYRAAIHLVEEAWNKQGALTLAEAVSVLLQTWNRQYYQFHPFTNQHFADIEGLLATQRNTFQQYRPREISSLNDNDEHTIVSLFQAFESVLGPVGAAKTLHLLAPKFFPIWDRTIAVAYGLTLSEMGTNGAKYLAFARCQKEQAEAVSADFPDGLTAVKAIDEYNYCHFSRGWI